MTACTVVTPSAAFAKQQLQTLNFPAALPCPAFPSHPIPCLSPVRTRHWGCMLGAAVLCILSQTHTRLQKPHLGQRLHGEEGLCMQSSTWPRSHFCFETFFRRLRASAREKRSKQNYRKRAQGRSQTSWLPSFPIPQPLPPEFTVEHTPAANSWPTIVRLKAYCIVRK